MAKRFTDTAIWDKAWFTDLPIEMKSVWRFLVDRCDHAGVWEINKKAFGFYIGVEVSIESILEAFGDRVRLVGTDKLFIPGFISFQYGELNPENRVHFSVISRLEKLGLYKGLTSPLQGAKDKDKEKDKDKYKEIRNEIEKIYSEVYPLKKGKQKGIESLLKTVKTPADLSSLRIAVERYRQSITDTRFIKHFSTFANEWRDWLDESAGKAEVTQKPKLDVSHHFAE